MEERRKYPRIKVNYMLWYNSTLDKATPSDSRLVFLQNISEGGALFITDEYLSFKTLLNMRLKLPKLESPLEIKGEVVRSKPTDRIDTLYNTAVRFRNIKKESSKKISQVIKKRI